MGYEITFLGLLVTLVYIGWTGFYPGGIIVPSYLVLFLNQPARLMGTLIAAYLTLLCFKIVSHFFILFGRRRFVLLILFSGFWTFLWLQLFPSFIPASVEYRVIGWVIPGLIANHFEKQGSLVTLASILTVTVVTYLLGQIIYVIY